MSAAIKSSGKKSDEHRNKEVEIHIPDAFTGIHYFDAVHIVQVH